MIRCLASLLGAGLLCFASVQAGVRINQIQFVGSHNSYKQAMPAVYLGLLGLLDADAAKALDYQQIPLEQQLDLGLRKLELDIFYEDKPAKFPVGHVQVIDMNSHCATLRECLSRLLAWSERHPTHAPIWISFNAKDQPIRWLPKPTPFDAKAFDAMDEVIEAVLGPRLIRPAQVKSPGQSVPSWPTLSDARGKFLLILDETGSKRDIYSADWSARPMFINVNTGHAAAAIMIVNDPLVASDRITRLVQAGYMVRTRADANTEEARVNDTRRRDAAFASGAQAISTDYYLPAELFGNDYQVTILGGIRCNPVTGTPSCENDGLSE